MTIKDLAKLACVSHSTVSRALNDSTLIPEETRNRIKKLASEHGYSPNSLARQLVTRKSSTIGLFFLSLEELNFMENFGTQFMTAITRTCHQHAYDLLLFTTPRDLANTSSYIELCRRRQVEGVIFMGMTSNDPHLEEIREAAIPVSIIDFNLEGDNTAFIGTDSEAGIQMALAWLHGKGHRDIVFIGGPEVSQVAMTRETAYRLYRENEQLEARVFRGDFSRNSGYRCAMEISSLDPLPTAVLAASDAMALGAIKAFKERGLRVPADISVMGYDDAAASENSDPGLTTIGQDANAIGESAVLNILDRIAGGKAEKTILIAPALVVRESVGRIIH